jgi:hypothetical protein
MRRSFEWLIRFFPEEYREIFGAEIAEVFASSLADHRHQVGLFFAKELGGLLRQLAREWKCKLAEGDSYLITGIETAGLSNKPTELKSLLSLLVKRLEFAISHHDFPGARYFAREEERVRTRLRNLKANV